MSAVSIDERRGERLVMALTALAAGAGVVIQTAASLHHAGVAAIAPTSVRTFSYFTILSNVMVALTCAHALLGRGAGFLGRPGVRAAIVVYIMVTGLVYWLILAGHIAPQGVYFLTNTLLHIVVPILYPVAWLVYGAHGRLVWTDAARWLVVPGAYMAWTLARGAWSGEYPYGFVDVNQLGIGAVLRNALVLSLVFVVLGLIVIAIDRALARRRAA
jgi:hypothetical protein